jgi:hypothetical protein
VLGSQYYQSIQTNNNNNTQPEKDGMAVVLCLLSGWVEDVLLVVGSVSPEIRESRCSLLKSICEYDWCHTTNKKKDSRKRMTSRIRV